MRLTKLKTKDSEEPYQTLGEKGLAQKRKARRNNLMERMWKLAQEFHMPIK